MPKPPDQCREAKEQLSAPAASPRSQWHLATADMKDCKPLGLSLSSLPEVELDSEEQAPQGPCVAWLLAWEGRQERLLRRHEEAMRQQVEALRREVLRTEGRLPRQPPGFSPGSSCSSFGFPRPSVGELADRLTARRMSNDTSLMCCSTPPGTGSPRPHPMAGSASRSMLSFGPKRSKGAERPKGKLRGALFGFVHSRFFAVVTSVMVALYTIAVGVMADWEMRWAIQGRSEPWWLGYVDLFFAAYFFAELVLRVVSDGQVYFLGSEQNWNIFDACVTLSGIGDIGLGLPLNIGFFRILRACRVIRVLRVLRSVSALQQLRFMTESLCACVPCLGWGLVLLGSLQYIFAVVLLRGAKQEIRDGSLNPEAERMLKENFCGMYSAMLSLTEGISGGRSWGEYAAPFMEVNTFYGFCFPAFMVFLIFGALNILTGIFVESTSCTIKQNKDLVVADALARAENAEAQIREFFEDMDIDHSGSLSIEELSKGLEDPRVRAYFTAILQIDAADTQNLFRLLDKDNDGRVCVSEFIEKCTKLRGGARAVDIAVVHKENGLIQKQFKHLQKALQDVSVKLQKHEAKTPL